MDPFALRIPQPSFPEIPQIKFPPERVFEQLHQEITELEAELVPGEDILGLFVLFGAASSVAITQIRLADQMICFCGIDDAGREVRLLQHFSQVSVLLVKDKLHRPTRAPIEFLTSP